MYYYGIDITYIILVIPAVIFTIWAQFNVQSTFKKYSKVPSSDGMTGYDSARKILDTNGLYHVQIERISGNLTDHYDPRSNIIRLSDNVYDARTASAVGVAAHEAGHAVQHSQNYAPMNFRSAIIPATRIGSNLAMPLIILGFVFSFSILAYLGVAFFALSTLFQLVTLPVEFNASSRAIHALKPDMSPEGINATSAVLRAAALTYVAALAVSLMNLLRLILMVSGRSNKRR